MEDRKSMLKEIMALEFSAYDLALYLDTHPFDQEALCTFRDLKNDAMEKKQQYEEMYGPLTMDNAAATCEWKWIENPWPWERMV